jgi:hypothetical protein
VAKDEREWTQTPADPYYSGKLLLPSFGIEVDGIEVARSAPREKSAGSSFTDSLP